MRGGSTGGMKRNRGKGVAAACTSTTPKLSSTTAERPTQTEGGLDLFFKHMGDFCCWDVAVAATHHKESSSVAGWDSGTVVAVSDDGGASRRDDDATSPTTTAKMGDLTTATTNERLPSATTTTTTTTTTMMSIAHRHPGVLLVQQMAAMRLIERIASSNSRTNRVNTRVVSFLSEISRLIRAMRNEYDSALEMVCEEMKTAVYEWGRYKEHMLEAIEKHKKLFAEERKRCGDALKRKDTIISSLQERLTAACTQLEQAEQMLEQQQHDVAEARRDAFTAAEQMREVERKLDDELFLASNQRCRSCQVGDKIREQLTGEIAQGTKQNQSLSKRVKELEGELAQQRRINEMQVKAAEKNIALERSQKSELEQMRGECEWLRREIEQLRSGASASPSTPTLPTLPDLTATSASRKRPMPDGERAETDSTAKKPHMEEEKGLEGGKLKESNTEEKVYYLLKASRKLELELAQEQQSREEYLCMAKARLQQHPTTSNYTPNPATTPQISNFTTSSNIPPANFTFTTNQPSSKNSGYDFTRDSFDSRPKFANRNQPQFAQHGLSQQQPPSKFNFVQPGPFPAEYRNSAGANSLNKVVNRSEPSSYATPFSAPFNGPVQHQNQMGVGPTNQQPPLQPPQSGPRPSYVPPPPSPPAVDPSSWHPTSSNNNASKIRNFANVSRPAPFIVRGGGGIGGGGGGMGRVWNGPTGPAAATQPSARPPPYSGSGPPPGGAMLGGAAPTIGGGHPNAGGGGGLGGSPCHSFPAAAAGVFNNRSSNSNSSGSSSSSSSNPALAYATPANPHARGCGGGGGGGESWMVRRRW